MLFSLSLGLPFTKSQIKLSLAITRFNNTNSYPNSETELGNVTPFNLYKISHGNIVLFVHLLKKTLYVSYN